MPNSSQLDVLTKSEVLLEALPYIQRFRGATFVVKYGGSVMDDPDPTLRRQIYTDLVFLAAVGIKVVVVHGGGKAISRAMEKAGLTPRFAGGMRVTDAATVELVDQTLNREINLEICEGIQARMGQPLGLPGNRIFTCEAMEAREVDGEMIDLGFVGEITGVRTNIILKALEEGYIPIITPTARDEEGQLYNTNADVAAAKVAGALRARRLVFMSDVPGLMRDFKDPGSIISTLVKDDVPALKAEGVISGGMIPKVDSALDALNDGVHRVHFIDGRLSHSLLLEIFTDKGVGTEIVHHGKTV
jgi:acetylglutamate kinase